MMRIALVAATVSLAHSAQAQTFELRRPSEPPSATPQITGGRKAVVANWPATFIFDAVAGGPCTATAIGPHVILTAAHCLPAGASGKVRNTAVTLWCEKAPLDNYGYDMALCASSAPIPIARNKPYESISVAVQPGLGAPLTMLGYGCTSAGGAGGVLYEGDAALSAWFLDGKQFTSSGVPALCSGDSGGGAYTPVGDGRRVVGVASDVKEGASRFTLLSHPKIVKFIVEWQLRQVNPVTHQPVEVKICGIDGTNAYCRS